VYQFTSAKQMQIKPGSCSQTNYATGPARCRGCQAFWNARHFEIRFSVATTHFSARPHSSDEETHRFSQVSGRPGICCFMMGRMSLTIMSSSSLGNRPATSPAAAAAVIVNVCVHNKHVQLILRQQASDLACGSSSSSSSCGRLCA